MKKRYAQYLLQKTTQDYNLIAEHFSRTRPRVWSELEFLAQYTLPGERVLDLGCGNGRMLEVFKDKEVDYIGVDSSERLVKIAKKRYPKERFIEANALALPFPGNYFQKIYSVAVLHHIPSRDFRLKFFGEARRVLCPGGLLVLSVWNLWPRVFFWKLFFKYSLLKLIGKSKLDFKDVFYPWKNQEGKIIANRYIHAFTKGELKTLVKQSGLKTKDLWVQRRGQRSNIFLVAEK